jgi:hypothetical protein
MQSTATIHSWSEIRRAVTKLKNWNAPGPDEIPAEAIKADTETAVDILYNLFKKILEKYNTSEEFKLPKKREI